MAQGDDDVADLALPPPSTPMPSLLSERSLHSSSASSKSSSNKKKLFDSYEGVNKEEFDRQGEEKPPAWQHFRHHKMNLLKNLNVTTASSPATNRPKGTKNKNERKTRRKRGNDASKVAHDNMHQKLENGSACVGVSISPSGKYVSVALLGSTSVKPTSRFVKFQNPVFKIGRPSSLYL